MTRSNAHFLRLTVLGAIGLRAAPLVVWGELPCMRDECTYIQIADRFLAGQGMTDSALHTPRRKVHTLELCK